MVEIVEMNEGNYGAAAVIDNACFFAEAWSEEQFRGELGIDFSQTYIAYDGQNAAGFVNIWQTPPSATINNIAVNPEYRRRGIADMLIDRAADFCKVKGLDELTLEVRVSNAPAIALYEKHGFKTVGRRKNFYSKPREDALIMTLIIRKSE